jgi:hypothetical protein
MAYTIPKTDFEPHPAGRHLGRIIQHEDKGLQDTPWGQKHKIAIYVESETAFMDDGQPFLLVQWFTLSSNERAALRKFREAVLDRPLDDEEIACFDADAELLWRRIRFRVDHVTNDAGKVRAMIREGSVEPVDDHDDEGGLADELGEEDDQQANPGRAAPAPPAPPRQQALGQVPGQAREQAPMQGPKPAPGEAPAHAPRQTQQKAASASQARPYGRPTTPVASGVRAYRGIGRGPSAAPLHGQAQHRPQQTTRQPEAARASEVPLPGDSDLPF